MSINIGYENDVKISSPMHQDRNQLSPILNKKNYQNKIDRLDSLKKLNDHNIMMAIKKISNPNFLEHHDIQDT